MKRSPRLFIFFVIIYMSSAAAVFAGGAKEPVLESRNFYALGTTCTVSIYDGKAEHFTTVEELILDIENRMSVNIKDSEINLVNASAGIKSVAVSPDVYEVISAGVRFSEISRGAFDITVGPLVNLWDIGSGGEIIPESGLISAALELVDYTRVDLFPSSGGNDAEIYLPVTGMALEPGGIAKGFAADAAVAYLINEGVKSALINFGGNVLTIGEKADDTNWRIGIQNPDASRGDYIGIASVKNKAVVTSGKYERFFIGSDGLRYHHILSTKDGKPVENGVAQVSIISTGSMTADAMSTTIFSLGLEEGLKLVQSMDGVEAIIVLENDEVYLTDGLKGVFKLTDGEFTIIK